MGSSLVARRWMHRKNSLPRLHPGHHLERQSSGNTEESKWLRCSTHFQHFSFHISSPKKTDRCFQYYWLTTGIDTNTSLFKQAVGSGFEKPVSRWKYSFAFSSQKGMKLPYELSCRVFACTQSIRNRQQLRSAQETLCMHSPNNILAAFHGYRKLSQISLVLANS